MFLTTSLVDLDTGGGAGGIDVGSGFLDDLDIALAAAQTDRGVDGDGLAQAQADARPHDARLVIRAEVEADDVVVARRQLGDEVTAAVVGDFRLELLQAGPLTTTVTEPSGFPSLLL